MSHECLRLFHYFQSTQDAEYTSPVSHRHPFSWMYVIYPKALEPLNQHALHSLKRLEGSAIEDRLAAVSMPMSYARHFEVFQHKNSSLVCDR